MSMNPSIFNRVDILEYLFDEPGQLSISLSYLCVVIVKRLRIRIIGFLFVAIFFWLYRDVIERGLLVELFAEVRDGSADSWTKLSAFS